MKRNTVTKKQGYIMSTYMGLHYYVYNLKYKWISGNAPLSWVNFYGLDTTDCMGKPINIIGD